MPIDPDDLLMCNCAECGRELLARSMLRHFSPHRPLPIPVVAGRVLDRPYCADCLSAPLRTPPPGRAAPTEDDGGPWQQNAVRDLEDSPDGT